MASSAKQQEAAVLKEAARNFGLRATGIELRYMREERDQEQIKDDGKKAEAFREAAEILRSFIPEGDTEWIVCPICEGEGEVERAVAALSLPAVSEEPHTDE